MRIGIAGPIEVATLSEHLPKITDKDLKLGLGGTAVNILIDGLINEGHLLTVFTLDKNIKEKHILEGPNLKIIIGHYRSSSKMKWFDGCRKEYVQIKSFILDEKENIDIVNAHWSYEYAIGTLLANVPHIITFRDHAQSILKFTKHPYRFTRLLMDSWVRRNGKKFTYNSPYLKTLINLSGEIIPNPIRDSEIKKARDYPDKTPKRICYIANGWDFRKNPEAALEAFYLLQKNIENLEFHLIGHGYDAKGENYEKAKRKGWDKNVYFRGSMNHKQLMHELSGFDILLHTAREESFGNIVIEAMAKGIPVVAGKSAGAIPWVLDNGLAGHLTDVENPNQIASDLNFLLSNPAYYEELSKNGITNLKNRFSQKAVSKLYLREMNHTIIHQK